MFKPILEEDTQKYKDEMAALKLQGEKSTGNVMDVLDLNAQVGERKNASKEVDSVECYGVDKEQYSTLIDDAPNIKSNIQVGQDEYKGFEDLNKDLYMSLYKYQPIVRAPDSMKDGYKFNNEMVRSMIESPSYDKLRKFTSMNDISSLIGTEVLSAEVLQIIKQYKEDHPEQIEMNNQMIQGQQGLEGIQGQINSLEGMKGQNGGSLPPQLQDMLDDLNQQKNNMEQSLNNLKPQLDAQTPQGQDMKNAIDQAVKEAAEKAEEAGDIINDWLGGTDPGELQRIPYQKKKDFIEKIRRSKKLQEMQKLVGRFKATARIEQKRKTKEFGHTIEDVKTGNKVEKLLASETMKLKNDVTKTEFMKRYNEKSLLEYETQNNVKKTQGPIIVAIDTSGSMNGDRECWSKAVAVSLLEIANIQKRNFAAVFFNTEAYKTIEIDKGKATPQQILDIAETFTSGGKFVPRNMVNCGKFLRA